MESDGKVKIFKFTERRQDILIKIYAGSVYYIVEIMEQSLDFDDNVIIYMSRAIWEFAQSADCSAQSGDPQIVRQSGDSQIAQVRSHLVT